MNTSHKTLDVSWGGLYSKVLRYCIDPCVWHHCERRHLCCIYCSSITLGYCPSKPRNKEILHLLDYTDLEIFLVIFTFSGMQIVQNAGILWKIPSAEFIPLCDHRFWLVNVATSVSQNTLGRLQHRFESKLPRRLPVSGDKPA